MKRHFTVFFNHKGECMNKFCLALLGIVALTLGSAQAYEKSEYKVRPWEIINGLQPYSEQLWQTDADGIAGWKATNGGVLSETSLTKLWGEKVTKLTFPKGGNLPTYAIFEKGQIRIYSLTDHSLLKELTR